jgi:cobalt-zinc-cadmium efflux system protein
MADSHYHHPSGFDRAFAIGIGLNLLYVLIEAGYGLAVGSLALLADAGHNLSDVLTLVLAWVAMVLARRAATARHTFGWKKATILASLVSALFLYAAIGVIIWEAAGRLRSPVAVDGATIMAVAAIGVVVNTVTALLFMRGRKSDLNIKGAFLHMAADAAVSAGVVLSGLAIRLTGWNILDPLISLVIALVIIFSGWGLLKDSFHLILGGVPAAVDSEAVLAYLQSRPGVSSVVDLHVWAASTTENLLTTHLLMPGGASDAFLDETARYLRDHHQIHHTTIQVQHNPSVAGPGQDGEVAPFKGCWPQKR